MSKRQVRTAFTAVELLVVISIIALMAALLLPAVQWARERSRQASCSNNLRQIAIAVQQHNGLWQVFPNAGGYDLNTANAPSASWTLERTETGGPQSKPLGAKQQDWGWAYQILPYLELESTYKISLDPVDPQHLYGPADAVVSVYFCPTRRKAGASSGSGCGLAQGSRGGIDYAGNGGYGNAVKSSASPGGKLLWQPIWPNRPGPDLSPPPNPLPPNNFAYPASNCDSLADGAVVPRKPLPGNTYKPISKKSTPDTQAGLLHENVDLGNIRDGASNTILAGERWFDPKSSSSDPTEDNGFAAGYTWDTIRWGYFPISNDYTTAATTGVTNDDYTKFGAAHRTVCHFVMCDGSTRPMSYTVDLVIFRQICARNDYFSPSPPGVE
jgi:type II secretory pathway pseudopilin PulG